jgi:ATP-dependent helicase HrpA
MALLKGLPKEYRKRLQPLAQTCEAILAEVAPEGPLPAALGRFLYERFGVDIPSSCWPIKELADHLKLRYSIVDEKDREVAVSRDMAILRQELVDQKESRAFAKARQTWERDGVTSWDFGELPCRVALTDRYSHALAGFPALVSSESGIGIRLFQSEREAASAHRRGVGTLLTLRFQEELKHLRKAVAPAGDLKLWAAAFGGGKVLENAIVERVRHELFEADVRSEAAFQALAGKVRPRILPLGQEILRLVGPPLKALYETLETLRSLEGGNRGNGPVLKFLVELRKEAACLLPADFLLRYEDQRLIHISRYLRALAVGAQRGALHLEKALERVMEIRALADWRGKELAALPSFASEEKRRALDDFVWLMEEYKVSLFAQELKTAVPVSRKRVEARMAEINRML